MMAGATPFGKDAREKRRDFVWQTEPSRLGSTVVVRIYLDMCCLKRPFDEQRQDRVRREALAVMAIVQRAEQGRAELVRSAALRVENDLNPREDRRFAAALWLDGAAVDVPMSQQAEARARALAALGFAPLDALHVALAELAGAKWLATCDDRLIAVAKRCAADLHVALANPCDVLAVEKE
jgi:predicted nucleic acid-binding protein